MTPTDLRGARPTSHDDGLDPDLDLRFDLADFDFLKFAGLPMDDLPPCNGTWALTEPAEEFWWENAPKHARRLIPGLLATDLHGQSARFSLLCIDLARFKLSTNGPTLAGNISRMLCEALSNAVLTAVAPKRGPGAQIGGTLL
jgi:hypothetical protein